MSTTAVPPTPVPRGRQVTTEVCPGGPLLVRGADDVVADDGEVHPTRRPVVALCRCACSARTPWCDGTHKQLPPDRRPDAVPNDVTAQSARRQSHQSTSASRTNGSAHASVEPQSTRATVDERVDARRAG